MGAGFGWARVEHRAGPRGRTAADSGVGEELVLGDADGIASAGRGGSHCEDVTDCNGGAPDSRTAAGSTDAPGPYSQECTGDSACAVPLTCMLGRCSPGYNCGSVTCAEPPPECGEDRVPEVSGCAISGPRACIRLDTDGDEEDQPDNCWTRACVPVEDCSGMSDCSTCNERGGLCVLSVTSGSQEIVGCLPFPSTCTQNPTCGCLDNYACSAWGRCRSASAQRIECVDRIDG